MTVRLNELGASSITLWCVWSKSSDPQNVYIILGRAERINVNSTPLVLASRTRRWTLPGNFKRVKDNAAGVIFLPCCLPVLRVYPPPVFWLLSDKRSRHPLFSSFISFLISD